MESIGNLPINCDVKTFNKIWCGELNDTCDSHCEQEVKPGIDEGDRFFGTHIREIIRTFKEVFKNRK